MANPFAAYLETKVLTASPLQLVHLAYEGAMESVADARSALAAQDIHGRVRAITRAQQIITELQTALNFEQGGELSTRLASLYVYVQQRLNDGNFQQADQPLAEVHSLLATVDEAWKQLADGTAAVPERVAAAPVMPEAVPAQPEPEPIPAVASPWMTESPAYSYVRSAYTL